MSNAPTPMTLPEFLAWEERQEPRFEFDGRRPVEMEGDTCRHSEIQFNLRKALADRLGHGPCRPLGPLVKIVVAGHVRYPDVLVTCSPQVGTAAIVEAPVVVCEILSDDTSSTDRIDKADEYLATESIQRYVILEQDRIAAVVLERRDACWYYIPAIGDAVLAMPELGIGVPLAECYAGVELPPTPEQEEAARQVAHAELMARLGKGPALNVPPWTREELYDDD